jgi:hypothetical protein
MEDKQKRVQVDIGDNFLVLAIAIIIGLLLYFDKC